MSDKIRVLVQMVHSTEIEMAASTRSAASAPSLETIQGFNIDSEFSPVQVPRKERRSRSETRANGSLFSFDTTAERSTYLIRGGVFYPSPN